jgi:hypothetical protein
MSLADYCNDDSVHTRNISIATYGCENGGIVVKGELKDDRSVPHYTMEGERLPPGTIHHMIIRMRMDGATLTISEIEVSMPGTPHPDCIETRDSLDQLVGLAIAPGFTSRVKRAVGGVKGCVHLTALLLAMAPAALQGYWTHRGRRPDKEGPPIKEISRFLIDTCRVWRKGGPLAEKLSG